MPEDKKRAQQKYKNKQLFQKSERKGDQVSGLLCPKLTELLYYSLSNLYLVSDFHKSPLLTDAPLVMT